ncbi:MAG: hypothetical protein H0T42_24315 [Deltaproteobacteria bacterium]|nr:hypothetical protein [Deltaproteobacteria bacterium]
MTRGLLVGGCCAVAIACSAKGSQQTAARSPVSAVSDRQVVAAGPTGMTPRDEIETLDREIEAQLTSMGVRPTPPATCAADASCAQVSPQPMSVVPAAADPTCKPAASDTCKDSCTLSDSICKNADRICVLAQQLGGTDAYANETCDRGNTSCKAARERCCSCL